MLLLFLLLIYQFINLPRTWVVYAPKSEISAHKRVFLLSMTAFDKIQSHFGVIRFQIFAIQQHPEVHWNGYPLHSSKHNLSLTQALSFIFESVFRG